MGGKGIVLLLNHGCKNCSINFGQDKVREFYCWDVLEPCFICCHWSQELTARPFHLRSNALYQFSYVLPVYLFWAKSDIIRIGYCSMEQNGHRKLSRKFVLHIYERKSNFVRNCGVTLKPYTRIDESV
jgi:hypothetical protein